MPAARITKPETARTLKDRLARLTPVEAARLLGPNGRKLMAEGGRLDEIQAKDVWFGNDLLRVKFPATPRFKAFTVTITTMADAKNRLNLRCTGCRCMCVHIGAVLSHILESKSELGLAEAPEGESAVTVLDDETLRTQALAEREERAKAERYKVTSQSTGTPWSDYLVQSAVSGKTYRVALRGMQPGDSYCSCPDFKTNTLGTCKHILHVQDKVRKKFSPRDLNRPFVPTVPAVHLQYGETVELRFQLPPQLDDAAERIVRPLRGKAIGDVHDMMKRLRSLEKLGVTALIYPDAEEFIQQRLYRDRAAQRMQWIRNNPAKNPLRKELLKTELLPYQLDGIAFAVGAGRAILADEMGLGKTIQGIGVAELFAREAGIEKVLIVCPASLKSQWRSEIEKFCERSTQLITGAGPQRRQQYENGCFFTICNYEQVVRDLSEIEKRKWDLIILDEGQRIKNWEAKTSRVIKGLRSKFALVLSGTPLENRLDDLYSVVQFIDDRQLGPAFRFLNTHRTTDEKGKVLGYRNLGELREKLQPILLRRTRASVQQDLPPRTTETVRIVPTAEQLEIHQTQMQIVQSIVRKPFITEMDLLRLQKALLMARMAADGTYLVTKENPNYSSKLERLDELFEQLFAEDDRKAVLFSEWTTMLDLIEPLLKKRGLTFVRLDGSVHQKKRPALVQQFQSDPNCRLFLTTNAGSTGLNLQSANTVINVDLPWNPAVLEQRIARAYRMGQTQPVQVYVLVSEGMIEEGLLKTLSAKAELAMAALDPDSDIDSVQLESGLDELKRRMERLLGSIQDAPVDESQKALQEREAEEIARKERLAQAGGQMLTAAISFLGELLPPERKQNLAPEVVGHVRSRLESCVTPDSQGRPQLVLALPDNTALDALAQALAGFLGTR